jgi:hypothetical protein
MGRFLSVRPRSKGSRSGSIALKVVAVVDDLTPRLRGSQLRFTKTVGADGISRLVVNPNVVEAEIRGGWMIAMESTFPNGLDAVLRDGTERYATFVVDKPLIQTKKFGSVKPYWLTPETAKQREWREWLEKECALRRFPLTHGSACVYWLVMHSSFT